MYGELRHIYAVSPDFNPGPFSCYEISKNVFVPLLNRPEIDSIPEMKAIFLLLFNYASQEIADLYGPFPYVDFKANKQSSPFTYNDLRTIYVNIKANVAYPFSNVFTISIKNRNGISRKLKAR